jgi:hypothetical protein
MQRFISRTHNLVHRLHLAGTLPAADSADFFRHIYRELNGHVHALAANPLGRIRLHQSPLRVLATGQLLIQFDGSYSTQAASIGWTAGACKNSDFDQIPSTGLIAAAHSAMSFC